MPLLGEGNLCAGAVWLFRELGWFPSSAAVPASPSPSPGQWPDSWWCPQGQRGRWPSQESRRYLLALNGGGKFCRQGKLSVKEGSVRELRASGRAQRFLKEPGELVDASPWSETRGTWEQTVPSCSVLTGVDLWGRSQKGKAWSMGMQGGRGEALLDFGRRWRLLCEMGSRRTLWVCPTGWAFSLPRSRVVLIPL